MTLPSARLSECPAASAPSPSSKASSSPPPRPRDHAALSASAGTGKTHVLTARVLRLLLAGVDPASILCLTFTKAGAAEMAERIHAPAGLLGAAQGRRARRGADRARRGCRSGGARQAPAPCSPGCSTRPAAACASRPSTPSPRACSPPSRPRRGWCPASGRSRGARSNCWPARRWPICWSGPRRSGDLGLIRDIQALSLRLGEGGAEAFLMALRPGARRRWRRSARARASRRACAAPSACRSATSTRRSPAQCCDELFDVAALRRIGAAQPRNGGRRAGSSARRCASNGWRPAPARARRPARQARTRSGPRPTASCAASPRARRRRTTGLCRARRRGLRMLRAGCSTMRRLAALVACARRRASRRPGLCRWPMARPSARRAWSISTI